MLGFLLRRQPDFLIGQLTEKIFPKFVTRSLLCIKIKAAFRLGLYLLRFLFFLEGSRRVLGHQFFTFWKLHVEQILIIVEQTNVNQKFILVDWRERLNLGAKHFSCPLQLIIDDVLFYDHYFWRHFGWFNVIFVYVILV